MIVNKLLEENNSIEIIDGHDDSSYFWIMPVRIIDYINTDSINAVEEMNSMEISIEEDDVDQYLTPFLYAYFDNELQANWCRYEGIYDEADFFDCLDEYRITGFEWYLTHNFYTFDAMKRLISDMQDTIDALSSGQTTEYTLKLKEKRGITTHKLVYAKGMSDQDIKEYNDNRPTVDDTPSDVIIDFYKRFISKIENMIIEGEKNGYDLISVMGP